MRKILYGLGVLMLALIVLAGVGIVATIRAVIPLDAQSKAYVDRAVPAIVAHWNPQLLLARATPQLRASVRPEAMVGLFQAFSRLGPMVAYQGATGGANISASFGAGSSVSAAYVAHASFAAGTATIRIALVKRHGHWKISGFFVNPVLTAAPLHRL